MKTNAQKRKALMEVANALRECAKENKEIGQDIHFKYQIMRAEEIEAIVKLSEETDAKLTKSLQRNTFG